MAEYALTTATSVALNSAIPFTETIVKGGCSVRHRSGSGIITLKGGTCCNPSVYRISFGANVTGVVGNIQLAIYNDGEILQETTMSVVPVVATDVWTLGTETLVPVECDCSKVSARVIDGASVIVNSAHIIVERVS